MPFIQRIIEPVFLSRPTQQSTSAATEQQPSTARNTTTTIATHDDFASISNCTLANILRQLASVVLVADEILSDLGNELQTIRDRSYKIQRRIIDVEKSLENIDTTIICKWFFFFLMPFFFFSFTIHNQCDGVKTRDRKWINKK